MQQYGVVLLWIFILAIILMSTPTKCGEVKEGFYTNLNYYKRYCGSCGWRNRYSCSKCTNCGFGIRADGYGECVPGDSSGPYFSNKYAYWEYGSPSYYAPFDNIFPTVRSRGIFPYTRWNLRREPKWRKGQSKHSNKRH